MGFRVLPFLLAMLLIPLSGLAEVVINELSYDPADSGEEGGALREFVELYNPGANSIDLGGYAFDDGIAYTFPQGTSLQPNSYLVVVRVPTLAMWRNRPYPVLGPYEGKLSNGGEKVVLRRPDGTIADQIKYDDDFPWPRGADGYGPTLERIAWDIPTDDYHSWRASLVNNGSPGAVNTVVGTPPRPIIHAHDIVPKHPSSSDAIQVRIGLDAPTLVSAAYLRWEANQKSVTKGVVNWDDTWRYWKGRTAPSNALEWTAAGFNDASWPEAMGGFGYGDLDQVNTELSDMQGNYSTVFIRKKFTVSDPAALGILALNIYFDDGFICYINGRETARSYAPAVYDYRSVADGSHESDNSETFELGNASDLLKAGENVIALAGLNITLANSTDFVLAASLLSSSLSSGNSRLPMTLAAEWVGGATYQATIPAQPNQTLVRYNVEVQLSNGQTLYLPHEAERRPFESFFVYDNAIPANLPILWLYPNQTTRLTQKSRAFSGVVVKPLGNEPVQVFDGATITASRNGHKVKFLKGEEFREDRTINLSLESPREGTTAGPQSPHVEHISYQLFKDFGVLTPRCDWYRVIENNAHSQRVAIQQPNEQFLKINGRDPDGNIYKIAYNEPGGYTKKTNLDEDDEDYRELFQYVNKNNRTTLAQSLRKYLVVEEVMGYNIATFLLSHWDGFKNNIFLYHNPPPLDKWEVIPWDVDKTFGYTDSDPMYWKMPIDFYLTGIAPGSPELTGRNLDGPICRPFHMDNELNQEFIRRVAEALDGLFSLTRVGGMIDDAQNLLLADLALQEQFTGVTNTKRRNQIVKSSETMHFFLTNRHQFLRTQLPSDFVINRTLPSASYHTGETLQGITLTLSALGGKTLNARIVEQLPGSFTASNIQTTAGLVTVSGNAITWVISNLTGQAELRYDLTAPSVNPPFTASISGTVTVGDINYSIGDSALKYLPDNVDSLGPDWVVGAAAGTWTIIDGVLNCYADDSSDPKHAWVNKSFGTGDYTVQADVRMLDWMDGDHARAGIAVRVNPHDGERALNLLFHNDTGSVDMLNDLVAWGTNGDYAWQAGEWYTMVLSAKGSVLEGQINRKDSNEIPYRIVWDNPNNALRSPGFPGLTGSTMQGLTAQYDNFQVLVDGKVVFSDNFNKETRVSNWEMY